MDDRAIEEALRLGGDHEAADRVAARRAKATIIPPPRGSDPQGAA